MVRLLPLLLTLTAWSCATTPSLRMVGREPDLLTPGYSIPLYLQHNMVFLAPLVADYIDRVHEYLEKHEPRLGRGPVVVYPHRGLYTSDNGVVGRVAGVREAFSREIRVEWNPNEGLNAYAEIRLQEAHWANSTHRSKVAKQASQEAKEWVASRY